MADTCRFCNLSLDKRYPKLNNLTSQLIQYHYLDEFYFYFSKPINEILSSVQSPESIQFKDVLFDLQSQDEELVDILTIRESKKALRELCMVKERKHYNINHNFLDCWKVFADREYYIKRVKRIENSLLKGRKKRRGPQYPLRSGNLLQNLDNQIHKSINSSIETKLHDIHNPEYSSELEHEETLFDFGESEKYGQISRLELKSLLNESRRVPSSIDESEIERKHSIISLNDAPCVFRTPIDRKIRKKMLNKKLKTLESTSKNTEMVKLKKDNKSIMRKKSKNSSKRNDILFKKKPKGQIVMLKNDTNGTETSNTAYNTERKSHKKRKHAPVATSSKKVIVETISNAQNGSRSPPLIRDMKYKKNVIGTSPKPYIWNKISSDNASTNFSSLIGSRKNHSELKKRKHKISLGIIKNSAIIQNDSREDSTTLIKYTISPQKAKKKKSTHHLSKNSKSNDRVSSKSRQLAFNASIKDWRKLSAINSSGRKGYIHGPDFLKTSKLLAKSWEPQPGKKGQMKADILFESLKKNFNSFRGSRKLSNSKEFQGSPRIRKPQTAREMHSKADYLNLNTRTLINQIKKECLDGKKKKKRLRKSDSKKSLWNRTIYSKDKSIYKNRKKVHESSTTRKFLLDLNPELFKTTGSFNNNILGSNNLSNLKATFNKKFSFKEEKPSSISPAEMFIPQAAGLRKFQSFGKSKCSSLMRHLQKVESARSAREVWSIKGYFQEDTPKNGPTVNTSKRRSIKRNADASDSKLAFFRQNIRTLD